MKLQIKSKPAATDTVVNKKLKPPCIENGSM